MEVIQINLNHCGAAQDLLWQATRETKCDVVMIAEPYRVPAGSANWVADKAGLAAIMVCGRYPIERVVTSVSEGFVISKINGVYVCSCYAPPRWTNEEFERMMDKVTEELIGRKPVIIGGDLNAWAVEWGSRYTDARGRCVLEALAKLDVVVANVGTTSTFHRNGRESIVDVTFCSQSLIGGLSWRVCDSFTFSDHQAIRYTVGSRNTVPVYGKRSSGRRWKTLGLNGQLLGDAFAILPYLPITSQSKLNWYENYT